MFRPVKSMTKSVILPLEGLPIGHLERTGQLADAGVTRSTQRHFHQSKQRAEQALGRTQGKAENPFKHQEGTNGLSQCSAGCVLTGLDGLGGASCPLHQSPPRRLTIRDWLYYDQLTTG